MPPAPPPTFSGSLQPKKKAELQQIAYALNILETGTNYELQQRIKKHLDSKPELEGDERFKGLYGSRRGRSSRASVQPAEIGPKSPVKGRFAPDTDYDDEKPSPSPSRRTVKPVVPLDPIYEAPTPHQDMRSISHMLKNPVSPLDETSPPRAQFFDHLVVHRSPSPARTDASDAFSVQSVRHGPYVIVNPEMTPPPPPPTMEVVTHKLQSSIERTRAVLSVASNIARLIHTFELMFILQHVLPWTWSTMTITPKFAIPLPGFPLKSLSNLAPYVTVWHWLLPTLLFPWIAGTFVSFQHPTSSSNRYLKPTLRHLLSPFEYDSLSASIVRFACQVVYSYNCQYEAWPFAVSSSSDTTAGPQPLLPSPMRMDVLGARWRLVSAGVILAFTVSEALFETRRRIHSE